MPIGIYKHKPHSEETKLKMKKNNCRYWATHKKSEEHLKKIGLGNKGKVGYWLDKKMSEETKEKQKQAKLKNPTRYWLGKIRGKLSDETKRKIGLANSNEKQYFWKGDNASYRSKHGWITRKKGKPTECSMCGKIEKRIHWANIDHKYRRVLSDYIALCYKCHGKYDKINNLRKHNK